MFQGLGRGARRIGLAAAAVCVLAGAGHAQQKVETFSDQAQILKRFPKDTGLVRHGAKVRLKTGGWLDITDNSFGTAPPTLCWYVPALHVAGICQAGKDVMVTILIDLNTGRRVAAPGLATLMPEPGLITIGPDQARGIDADSVTLVQVEGRELVDEGGVVFDDDYGPGGWVDGDCYRLTPKGGKGPAWLERGASGWDQVSAADSKVCRKRHG